MKPEPVSTVKLLWKRWPHLKLHCYWNKAYSLLANRIGSAVLAKSKQVEIDKWKVLASIILSNEVDEKFLKVICVTSGSRCIKGDALSLTGSNVNDCHAEILARRCFISFLYQQLESLVNSGYKGKVFIF